MKQKAILGLTAFLLIVVLTGSAYATWTLSEGIDGYVYRCGIPEEGIIVRVYDASNNLVGNGVNDDSTKGTLGTDITDVNGYFHIAWLEGLLADYTVVAETPSGYLIGTPVDVIDLGCGETRHICFNYCPPCEAGYTPGFWKHNIGVALGYNPGNYSAFSDGTKLTSALLQGYAATVGKTLEEAYAAVSAKGNTEGQAQIRANMANLFNEAAGYGPFVDED